ncbi:hypothetical protein IC229_14260 [Spirosoma sp. BT702]|uniref:Uncharacterized protein n=1 Tax=Spirosoma profusum TaxID=2771354 RepID=A0A926Y3H4_9BACT|nr:hypothetical protein [Spirosoma profusum]MBD2701811.1 hypothetical protein [Spirosoma profusum]
MVVKTLENIFMGLYYGSLLGAIYCSVTFKNNHSKAFQKLWIYLILTLIVEMYTHYENKTGGKFLHVYVMLAPFEYFFISQLYLEKFKDKFLKNFIVFTLIAYTILCAFLLIDFKNSNHYFAFNLRGILIIILTLIYFKVLYQKDELLALSNQPLFWLSIGNFIFWPGIFFVMGFTSILVNIDKELNAKLFLLNPLLNAFYYGTFIAGFLCNRTPKK